MFLEYSKCPCNDRNVIDFCSNFQLIEEVLRTQTDMYREPIWHRNMDKSSHVIKDIIFLISTPHGDLASLIYTLAVHHVFRDLVSFTPHLYHIEGKYTTNRWKSSGR